MVKGLAEGDVVVTAGQIKIRGNNVPVRIAGAEPSTKGDGPAKGEASPKAETPAKAEAPAKGSASPDASKKGS